MDLTTTGNPYESMGFRAVLAWDRTLQPSDAVAAPATLGKYRLIAELGQGGMADVYLAMIAGPTGSGFTKLAVIKRLRPNLVEDPEFVAMLVDEARISARLNHPNVVQTLEVGVEREEYYLAMEFLDGQPLHRIQRRASRTNAELPRDLACLVVADVLSGLHHAHELADYDGSPLGVVHRDVNPQNVFVTYEGSIKVVDFGIAKAAGRVAETRQGIVKGKVRYMSPEQALGTAIDRRSDVFAAGLLLWEAVTGKRFWGELNDLDIIHALVTGDFDPSPRSVDPSVPEALDAMCCRALASRPDHRYATAGELRDALEAFLSESMVNARRRLGSLVAAMFAKERADVRSVIQHASRSAPDALSMAILLGSSHTSRVSDLPPAQLSSGSIAPVFTEPQPPSGAAPLPLAPERRSRLGTTIAVIAMLASAIVLFIELTHARSPSVASAAGAQQRPRNELVSSMTRLAMTSAVLKPAAVPSSAPAAPEAPRPAFVRASNAAPPPAAPGSTRPAAPSAATSSDVPDARRRPKATIDTADPWSKREEDAK